MEAISDIMKKVPVYNEQTKKIQEQIIKSDKRFLSFKETSGLMKYEEFKLLISVKAQKNILERSIKQQFLIDHDNEPIIRQLYLYFTNKPECAWNLNAGLIFGGSYGCGKTILMLAFIQIADKFSEKQTTFIESKSLLELAKQDDLKVLYRRPLLIDDLGREDAEVKSWGTTLTPVIDLFAHRYTSGARTYATTNFKYHSLEGFYGKYIRTRMEEMMTYVDFPGESRRLKNEVKTTLNINPL